MDNKDSPQTPIKPIILGEFEFLRGCIRLKITVKNTPDMDGNVREWVQDKYHGN
jgi:hypothetical protein